MAMASVKTNVVLIDGQSLHELFWLRHCGTDVYFGIYGDPKHNSYHASGEFHGTTQYGIEFKYTEAPLARFDSPIHLITYNFNTSETWPKRRDRLRRADAVLALDRRVFGARKLIHVVLGLIPPDRLDLIPVQPRSILNTRQILISTTASPWVYMYAGTDLRIPTSGPERPKR